MVQSTTSTVALPSAWRTNGVSIARSSAGRGAGIVIAVSGQERIGRRARYGAPWPGGLAGSGRLPAPPARPEAGFPSPTAPGRRLLLAPPGQQGAAVVEAQRDHSADGHDQQAIQRQEQRQ